MQTQPARRAAPPRRTSPVVWIVAALAAVLVVTVAAVALLLAGGGGQGTPLPTAGQAVVWDATATEVVEVVFTASPAVVATDTPSDTPVPEPTDTVPPTDTDVMPTDTPTATESPEPPTDTPTATPTATPKPTRTPTATAPPPCAVEAQGLFSGLWQTYRSQLGCPLYASPRAIQDAEQAFDNGHMFWRADNDRAYVVYEQGPKNGTFQSFAGMWVEGDPEYSCAASPPPGKVQPKRGFGAVWCTLGGASAPIGWGLGEERGFGPGYGDPLVQDFERGSIFRDSDGTNQGMAYVLFGAGSFKRVNY